MVWIDQISPEIQFPHISLSSESEASLKGERGREGNGSGARAVT